MKKSGLLLVGVLGIAVAIRWTAAAQSPAGQSPSEQVDAPQVIEVSAKKYEFTPAEIHVRKGAKVELKVHSEDETHGIKLSDRADGADPASAPGLLFGEPGQNGKVKKHVDQIIDFTAQEAGTYDFKCAKICGFGHGSMKGKLIVDE
jgi:cytochrome c oxidase subunit 2